MSTFNELLNKIDPDDSIIFKKMTRHNLIFLFFWGGVYSEDHAEHYVRSVYPFYLLMLMAVLERIS